MVPTVPFVPPELVDNEVHLLGIDLDLGASMLVDLAVCLSPQEKAQAERLRHEQDRRRFVAGRTWLRHVLGAYTSVAPAHLSFLYGSHGKPALADDGNAKLLHFNLSHSGRRALLGLTLDREIGVDIEEQREMVECEDIARRHFAPAEFEHWLRMPAARRLDAFFSCWTRKEAYVKAVGGGLSIDLSSFEVSVDPDAPARLISIAGSTASASAWSLWTIELGSTFRATVAVMGTGLTLRRIDIEHQTNSGSRGCI